MYKKPSSYKRHDNNICLNHNNYRNEYSHLTNNLKILTTKQNRSFAPVHTPTSLTNFFYQFNYIFIKSYVVYLVFCLSTSNY